MIEDVEGALSEAFVLKDGDPRCVVFKEGGFI
jgi:hypothetical protein